MASDPQPSTKRQARAEVARMRERLRANAKRLDEGRDASRQVPGAEVLSPEEEAETKLAERIVERPELGVLILILWPAWLAYRLWQRGRREHRHEDFAFRYHDFAARNPELGLLLSLGLAGISIPLVGVGLIGLLYVVAWVSSQVTLFWSGS